MLRRVVIVLGVSRGTVILDTLHWCRGLSYFLHGCEGGRRQTGAGVLSGSPGLCRLPEAAMRVLRVLEAGHGVQPL